MKPHRITQRAADAAALAAFKHQISIWPQLAAPALRKRLEQWRNAYANLPIGALAAASRALEPIAAELARLDAAEATRREAARASIQTVGDLKVWLAGYPDEYPISDLPREAQAAAAQALAMAPPMVRLRGVGEAKLAANARWSGAKTMAELGI